METTSPLTRAIRLIGRSSLAGLYEPPISHVAVRKWERSGVVPEDRCPAIEKATSGLVTCEQLRPDVAWVRDPQTLTVTAYQVPVAQQPTQSETA